jgi:hypothetical protein
MHYCFDTLSQKCNAGNTGNRRAEEKLMMTAERLAEIKRRCEAATQGSWTKKDNNAYQASCLIFASDGNQIAQVANWQNAGFNIDADKNAEFIAHARQDIPDLLDEIERLTRERNAAVKDLNELRRKSGPKCFACIHSNNNARYDRDYSRDKCVLCESPYSNYGSAWQWRGLEEVINE